MLTQSVAPYVVAVALLGSTAAALPSQAVPARDASAVTQSVEASKWKRLLVLERIECLATDDYGKDEIFIKVHGQRVWGPKKMRVGQSRNINKTFTIRKKTVVQIWDKDAIGKDDKIGGVLFKKEKAWNHSSRLEFTNGDGRYVLYYTIKSKKV